MSVFQKWGLKEIINASGKMTALGASAITHTVAEAMGQAASSFVKIDDLFVAAGKPIAEATGAEDGCPTTGAAAGIAISVAAVIAGTNLSLIERIPDTEGLKNQIIIQKGQSVNFGAPIRQMIAIGGGRVVEVGQANLVEPSHIEDAITENTAALIYIKSHHAVQKGMVSLEDMIAIAKRHGVPLIVDAAAEEDLRKYIRLGADLVLYSGGKAIGGPTSGFICGRHDLIEACRAQYKGVGRPMKIGKEGIVGLLTALEEYLAWDATGSVRRQQNESMRWLVGELQGIPGVTCELRQDEAGRQIYRAYIQIDATIVGKTALDVIRELESGDPAIYTRNHYANVGCIAIDPRPLFPGQEKVIARELKRILGKEGSP
ncbi:selenocysteine synthase [Alicyclobacillus contaminans]|uniref:DgaE family pyridoxal phosphate-dependent ammonia lyase n=1 Tax=Alicyclobacillus contaminans TaxID=392016 RepID=UPI0003FD4CEE|nr:DgaE family pyridoxal phosphate-dependent ammonia lyase [Alicyclobacillus contaminans]GMA48944.1 selenocysteine synthase [Alicyclobacillus contaminans]